MWYSIHPRLLVYRTEELRGALAKFVPGDVASIHQVFAGPVAGDALLILNYAGAVQLTDLLTDEDQPSVFLDESAREVLTEVGNILLNACLGMFGNLLNVHVTFSVPRLHLETLDELIASTTTDKTGDALCAGGIHGISNPRQFSEGISGDRVERRFSRSFDSGSRRLGGAAGQMISRVMMVRDELPRKHYSTLRSCTGCTTWRRRALSRLIVN